MVIKRKHCSANKKAIAHFEHVRRLIAKYRVGEPLPRTTNQVIDRMLAIDPRSGMGVKDPLGGDLVRHLAYVEFREEWVRKRLGHGETY